MLVERLSGGKISKGIAFLGSSILLAALALFAVLGSFSRFWADDYCYSALIRQYGYLGGIVNYYLTSGNRFATIATVGLVDVFGPRVVSVLPLLVIGFWVFAWYTFLNQVSQLAAWRVERGWLFFTALLQVYFAVLLSPDRLQVIYWRLGLLHYTFPLPLLLLQLSWVAAEFRRGDLGQTRSIFRRPIAWILLLVAFYAAGQCETPAFLQAGVYGVLFLVSWFTLSGSRRTGLLKLLSFPLAGTLLAIIIIFLSPFNDTRLHDMPPPGNLWLIIPYSFRYVLDFIFYSIRGQVVPYLVYAAVIAAVSALLFSHDRLQIPARMTWMGLLLTPLLTVLLMACSFAPSAYANLQYPSGRALMPGFFGLLTGLGLEAFFAAAAVERLFRQGNSGPVLRAAALAVVLAASLYPIYTARHLVAEGEVLAERAARWDARDSMIRESVAGGAVDLQVKEVEVVHTLDDLGPDTSHWINTCAAVYYGVRSITASP